MSKRMIGGLVLALLVLATGTTSAAAEKMTRDEYKAKLADYTQRAAAAEATVAELHADIGRLNAELAQLNESISRLQQNILNLIGASEPEVIAFEHRLDAITADLEELLTLAPDRLIQRSGEVKALLRHVGELRACKISALPEMRAKLDHIDGLLATARTRIYTPVTVDYTVERGDNLWSIARKDDIYADPYMWPRIYRANRNEIRDPDLIFPAQRLAIPFGVTESQYLVLAGDFLYGIAAEVYGDPTKWHRIYQANKEQIVEPHMIFPAQVLEVPAN